MAPIEDQHALALEIGDLAQQEDEDSEVLLCLYMPLVSTSSTSVIEMLAGDTSFLVREALAVHMAARPNSDLEHVAAKLAEDSYPQVSRPGKKALSAIRRMKYGSDA